MFSMLPSFFRPKGMYGTRREVFIQQRMNSMYPKEKPDFSAGFFTSQTTSLINLARAFVLSLGSVVLSRTDNALWILYSSGS